MPAPQPSPMAEECRERGWRLWPAPSGEEPRPGASTGIGVLGLAGHRSRWFRLVSDLDAISFSIADILVRTETLRPGGNVEGHLPASLWWIALFGGIGASIDFLLGRAGQDRTRRFLEIEVSEVSAAALPYLYIASQVSEVSVHTSQPG